MTATGCDLPGAGAGVIRDDQLDQDSLPPYPVLDRILESYVERRMAADEIVRHATENRRDGASEDTVRSVLRMVDRNGYKRRQAPPGVKIAGLAFGRDRRLPIARKARPSALRPPRNGPRPAAPLIV